MTQVLAIQAMRRIAGGIKHRLTGLHQRFFPPAAGIVIGDPRKLELFQTPLGRYYVPVNVTTDAIANAMKEGRIFEPEVVDAARPYIRPGSTVLDVGANFGQMTLLFSDWVGPAGRVLSFEADRFTFSVLEKNIAANSRANIEAICSAVYDESGKVLVFPEPDFKQYGTFGSYGIDPRARSGRKVETLAIDSLNIESPISFMKVNVQGSDLFALRGAVNTIRRHRMAIIFEYEEQFQSAFRTSHEDYMRFVSDIGYRVEQIVMGINYLIVPND